MQRELKYLVRDFIALSFMIYCFVKFGLSYQDAKIMMMEDWMEKHSINTIMTFLSIWLFFKSIDSNK